MRQRGKDFEKEFADVLNILNTSGPGKEVPQRRRFFQSGAKWDSLVERVMVVHREIGSPGPLQVPPLPAIGDGHRKPRNGGGGNGGNGYRSGQWGEDSDDGDGEYGDEGEDREDSAPDRDATDNGPVRRAGESKRCIADWHGRRLGFLPARIFLSTLCY